MQRGRLVLLLAAGLLAQGALAATASGDGAGSADGMGTTHTTCLAKTCGDCVTAKGCVWCDTTMGCVGANEKEFSDCALYQDTQDGCEGPPHFQLTRSALTAFAIVGIVLGLVFCLAGFRLLKASFFMSGFIVGFVGGAVMMYHLTIEIRAKWSLWVVGTVLGLILGFVFVKLYKVGAFVIGALCGAVVGLHLVLLLAIHAQVWIQWASLGLLALVLGALAVHFDRPVLIVASAIVGAFGIARAIDYLAGDPVRVFAKLSSGLEVVTDAPAGAIYGYFIGLIVASVAGVLVQWCYTAPKRVEDFNDVDFEEIEPLHEGGV